MAGGRGMGGGGETEAQEPWTVSAAQPGEGHQGEPEGSWLGMQLASCRLWLLFSFFSFNWKKITLQCSASLPYNNVNQSLYIYTHVYVHPPS